MAMDKNELTQLTKAVPKLTEKDLPDLADRVIHVETQIKEFKKVLYRLTCDVEVSKNYASKDDTNAITTAQNKLQEVTGQIKGCKWTLEALRGIRADLEVELNKAANAAKLKKDIATRLADL